MEIFAINYHRILATEMVNGSIEFSEITALDLEVISIAPIDRQR